MCIRDSLITIHPSVIGSFCTLRVSDRLQHIFGYFYKVICFINIGIQDVYKRQVFSSYPSTLVRINSIIMPPPAPINPQIKPIITPQILSLIHI